jgi:hypothetical protein
MEYKNFNYSTMHRLGMWISCFVRWLVFLMLIASIVYCLLNLQIFFQDAGQILLTILILIAFIVLDIYVSFQSPDLRMNEKGVELRFDFWWLPVAWGDIKKARRVKRFFYEEYVVCVHHLSPLHCLYGLTRLFRWEPCFLIHSSLPGYTEAISEIRRHIRPS